MKKLLAALSLISGLGLATAQQATPVKKVEAKEAQIPAAAKTAKKTSKTTAAATSTTVKLKKDGTPDKRYKTSKHLKKDGTPDKRYKANK
ncbi:hypothetical protein [Daejeonia sp. YH14]|uniref:hypothetical protein n=1 Tax=Daejeonia sp. YH14 TaxID=3439042 RepID=UPI003F4909BF